MKKFQIRRYRLRMALAAAALIPAFAAAPALAHDALESTVPGVDATVAVAPSSVSLTLSNPPADSESLKLSLITVTDGEGKTVSDGQVTIQGPTLSTKITNGSSGQYKVLWRAVSSDGHPIEGNYAFTVQDLSQGATVTAAPTTVVPEASPAVNAASDVTSDQPESSNAGGLVLAIGIPAAILAAIVGTMIIVRRSLRKSEAP
ncbi:MULTISPECIES: copper resistance CopC family protein [Micrococcaceae]|uniref:copper resistance CopC family protein n=1 Tax=Micrococcaceae TaxID=1268 RepID=UPI000CE48630|nr:copper resistance CopC family protein [Arthrobacter sp. N199823]